MKLVSLRIEGYGPFRDARVLDFPSGGVFTLVGPNGTGKSTLLDAVAYSLFAQVARAGITPRELIPDGVNAATFELSIAVGERRLTVWRKLPAAKAAAAQAQLVEHTPQGDVNLAAGQEAVTARLEQELGLSFSEFVRTVLLAQGQTSEFLLGDRSRRRDVLDRLLDLSVYGRLADAAGRARDEARAALGAAHARLGEHSPERADVAAAEAALAAAVATQRATLGHERAARERAADRIEAEAAERAAADRLTALGVARDDWVARSESRRTVEAGLTPLAEAATHAVESRVEAEAARDSARAAHDTLLQAGPDVATCEAALAALGRIAATEAEVAALDVHGLGAEVAAARLAEATARTAADDLDSALKAAAAAAAEAVRAREEAGRVAIERARLVSAIRDAGANEAARMRDECAAALEAAAAARVAAEADATRVQAENAAAHLRIGLAPGDPCPVCDQPVPLILPAGAGHAHDALCAAQRASDAARAQEQGASGALADAHGRAVATAAAVEAAKAALAGLPGAADLDALAARATELVSAAVEAEASAAGATERSRAAATQLAAATTAHAHASMTVARAEGRLEADRAVVSSATIPPGIESAPYLTGRLAEIGRLAATAGTAQATLDTAYAAERAAREMLDAAAHAAREAVANAAAAAAALSALASAAGVAERGDVGAASDAAEATWQRAIDDARGVLKQAREEEAAAFAALALDAGDEAGLARMVAAAARDVGIAEAGVATAQRERDAIQAAREEADAAEVDLGWWEELAKDLAGNRLHDYVARRAAQVLSARASEWLLDLTGGRYELRYQQHGANSSFAVLDRHAGAAPRNAATLSGGERFVAALAVALGLAAVAADRARLETLLIDEGFGALDDDRLDAVREALERLALDGGRLVGVVTHLPDLAEEVGTRIDVTALPPG